MKLFSKVKVFIIYMVVGGLLVSCAKGGGSSISRDSDSLVKSNFLMIGNRTKKKIQIFELNTSRDNLILTDNDIIWESPEVNNMTEVKPILYKGKKAILSTTNYGAIVFELSEDKKVLFYKEVGVNDYNVSGIHSAEPLPDGSIVIASSGNGGFLGILPAKGNDGEMPKGQFNAIKLKFAHALSYNKTTDKLYAGGYTTIKKYAFTMDNGNPKLNEEATYDISENYLRCKVYNLCDEDDTWEDGIHDMYEVYGEKSGLYFLSTGERVFLFDSTLYMKSGKIALNEFKPFYEIDSSYSNGIKNTAERDKIILKKGGVKSVSGFINKNNFLTVAQASPWFTENVSYFYDSKQLIFATSADDTIDIDITDKHKIKFSLLSGASFYKARLLDKNWMPNLKKTK